MGVYGASAYLHTRHYGRRGRDKHERAVGIFSRQEHTATLYALKLTRRQIGDEADLLANEFFRLVVFGDATDYGALFHAVVYEETEELVSLGHFLALKHRAYAEIALGKCVKINRLCLRLGTVVAEFVFLLDAGKTVKLTLYLVIFDFCQRGVRAA